LPGQKDAHLVGCRRRRGFVQALTVNILADEFRLLTEPGCRDCSRAGRCLYAGFFVLSPPLVAQHLSLVLLHFRGSQQAKATALVGAAFGRRLPPFTHLQFSC
jgi:hypothetical protein